MTCMSVILAAGQGKRMKSRVPKVLHMLAGKPLLQWALDAVGAISEVQPVIVVGPDAADVRVAAAEQAEFAEQTERLGTGHAVMQAQTVLRDYEGVVVVTYADMPLLRPETLQRLVAYQAETNATLAMLTVVDENPRGFGRITRDQNGDVTGIVEEAEATSEQLQIKELNPGVYCFQAEWLWTQLPRLRLSIKGEYFLTDLVAVAVREGQPVATEIMTDKTEFIGINTRAHLAEAEAAMRQRINQYWMGQGVSIRDPQSTYIDAGVWIAADTLLLPNTFLQGETRIGSDCVIGPNTMIRDTNIADRCEVTFSVLESALLEDDVDVGPFAHLRVGAHLMQGVHMGNFGEIKNSTLGAGVKMGHFSYLGDTTVQARANIGAGTITCNYDGKKKHLTHIGEDAFIGSGTMLVAPVVIGKGAVTGAGSVVTRDVADKTVVVGVPAEELKKGCSS